MLREIHNYCTVRSSSSSKPLNPRDNCARISFTVRFIKSILAMHSQKTLDKPHCKRKIFYSVHNMLMFYKLQNISFQTIRTTTSSHLPFLLILNRTAVLISYLYRLLLLSINMESLTIMEGERVEMTIMIMQPSRFTKWP